jgi:hypothetical protein
MSYHSVLDRHYTGEKSRHPTHHTSHGSKSSAIECGGSGESESKSVSEGVEGVARGYRKWKRRHPSASSSIYTPKPSIAFASAKKSQVYQ